MKKAIVIVALFILTKPFFPLVEYVVNYEYIAKELCVNKEQPVLACNGKCYLMSELAKASDTDTQKPLSDKKIEVKQIELLYFQEIEYFNFNKTAFVFRPKITRHYTDLYQYLDTSSVFHPPTIII